jgi:tetratricopeptide (TPR) repeat protein
VLNPAEAANQLGWRHYTHDRYGEAIQAFSQAIDLAPTVAEYYVNRAIAEHRLGQNQAVIRDATEAIRRDGMFMRAYIWRAKAYEQLGDFNAAIENYTDAIQVEPENPLLWRYRSGAYRQIGNVTAMIADFVQSKRVKPWPLTSFVEASLGARFLSDLNAFIQENPTNSDAYIARGFVQYTLKDVPATLRDFDEAQRLNPLDAAIYRFQGYLIADRVRALEAFTRSLTLQESPLTYEARAICYWRLQDLSSAIADITRAIALSPKNATLYMTRAQIYGTQRTEAALYDLNQALKLAPLDMHEEIQMMIAQIEKP